MNYLLKAQLVHRTGTGLPTDAEAYIFGADKGMDTGGVVMGCVGNLMHNHVHKPADLNLTAVAVVYIRAVGDQGREKGTEVTSFHFVAPDGTIETIRVADWPELGWLTVWTTAEPTREKPLSFHLEIDNDGKDDVVNVTVDDNFFAPLHKAASGGKSRAKRKPKKSR